MPHVNVILYPQLVNNEHPLTYSLFNLTDSLSDINTPPVFISREINM